MANGIKVVLILSAMFGYLGAIFMSRYAYKLGLLDIPNNRSSHTVPTPRGGGVGLLFAFTVFSVWFSLPVSLWSSATLLALIGFFDDKLDLSPRARLGFQFTAALVVVAFHFPNSALPKLPSYVSFFLMLLCIVFIVGTTNFFNFMDGINGIAGITGVVAFSFLAVFADVSGCQEISIVAACIAAACIGFLPLNMPRAKVFMGDVGSIFLGFTYAVFVVILADTASDFLVLVSFLFTFYADALTTLYFRWRDGEKLFHAHRRHLYQLLSNQREWQHWQTTILYGAVQILVSGMMLMIRQQGMTSLLLLLFGLSVLFFVATFQIRKRIELVSPEVLPE